MHEIIETKKAPAAVGPYSQAVVAGDLVFVSGQIPLDPATGQLCGGSIEEQTKRVLENAGAILEAAGCTLESVCKTTIFLTDLNNFKAVNGIYGSFFAGSPPARSTVQVAALPLGAEIEIEVVARRG